MRPYLSPAKIVVFTLIGMYCTDAILDTDDDFILQLISCYLADSYARPSNQRQRHLARWQRALLNVDLLCHLRSLRPALERCAANVSRTTLPPRETLWDDLVIRLWLPLTSLDDMAVFFEQMQAYIAPTYAELRTRRELGLEDPPETTVLLDRRSPMGQVVYQACIEFGRLSFSDRCNLWEDYVRYRHPTLAEFKAFWPHDIPADAVMFDAVLTEGQREWGAGTESIARVAFDRMLKDRSVAASSDDTDKLMTLLIDRERMGFRPDQDLRDATNMAIEGSTLIPAHTTQYRLLDASRMGDANTAYDQLHRFFDLVARQGMATAFGYGYNAGPLNKGVIQRDFGEHSNDLLSMLDAVHAGREARDYNSLRFSLLWLYMYARVLPRHIRPHQLQGLAGQPTDGQQVLPYVRQDAAVTNFHGHHAQASLLEARVALMDGRPPLFAKTCLREGSRTIVNHCEVTLEGQLASISMLFWDHMGHGPLAVYHGRAFMRTRHDDVPFDDAARVASRLALQYAQSGEFLKAKAAILKLNPEGLTSVKPQSILRHVLTYTAAIQAIRANRFEEADDLLLRRLPKGGFPSCAPPSVDRKAQGPSQLDPDLAAQVALLHVESLARREDASLVAAREALDTFEASYDKGVGDLHVLLQIALARSDLYARAGRGLRVLTFLIRTVQACLQRRYHQLLWDAVGAMARLLVAVGEFRAARTLLDILLPRVLGSGHTEATALLYQDLADAYMGLAGQARTEASASSGQPQQHNRGLAKIKSCLSRAWWCLGQAQVHFRSAGSGDAVQNDITMKRRVILSVSQRLEAGIAQG